MTRRIGLLLVSVLLLSGGAAPGDRSGGAVVAAPIGEACGATQLSKTVQSGDSGSHGSSTGTALGMSTGQGAGPLPFAPLVPCPGIRPGAYVLTERPDGEQGGCTLNFVFRGTRTTEDGTVVDEGLYVGTAGHCVIADREATWDRGKGPVASQPPRADSLDPGIGPFGRYVYANNTSPKDFALIRVDEEHEDDVDPRMCHFGGPDGATTATEEGELVHHIGQGLGTSVVTARTGRTLHEIGDDGEWTTGFAGVANLGDSGSPVIDENGEAFAVVVAVLPPLVAATKLVPHVEDAEAATGLQFTLLTAAFDADPPEFR